MNNILGCPDIDISTHESRHVNFHRFIDTYPRIGNKMKQWNSAEGLNHSNESIFWLFAVLPYRRDCIAYSELSCLLSNADKPQGWLPYHLRSNFRATGSRPPSDTRPSVAFYLAPCQLQGLFIYLLRFFRPYITSPICLDCIVFPLWCSYKVFTHS
jgi:hypothetical protein